MAVGLQQPGNLFPVEGVELATAEAGIRHTDRKDMVLLTICEGANSAAVFTRNNFCAAPVTLARQNISSHAPRALLVNSGNANAGTGQQGMQNAQASCENVARLLGIDAQQVLPFSTGVIGEQLPMKKMDAAITGLAGDLHGDNWLAAAQAIMTTDTIAKAFSEKFEVGGRSVTITGIAKGSGMICPDMATMLSFVATDALIDPDTLQTMLERANKASFNRITVDSDTSTNDALVLIATGQGGAKIHQQQESEAQQFYAVLESLLISLATAIVRDGEGASKFVKISIIGADNHSDARSIAYSVAHSPLVKTALYASDPNWGRILAAVGKAPVDTLAVDEIDIRINGTGVIERGQPARGYTEKLGQQAFRQAEIDIAINLNLGEADYHVWTSDLSHDYVSINADYRS